jgi:hypothetical protein
MASRECDLLDSIPPPDDVRRDLTETLKRASQLRALLELAERLHLPVTTGDTLAGRTCPVAATAKAVRHG